MSHLLLKSEADLTPICKHIPSLSRRFTYGFKVPSKDTKSIVVPANISIHLW
jgi:hypothetical protein